MRYARFISGLCAAVFILASVGWAAPLDESFSLTNFPPLGWQSLQTADGANVWIRSTSYTHTSPAAARSSDEDLGVGLTSARWLITPPLAVDVATDSIAFWVRTYSAYDPGDDSLFIVVSSTDALPASFTDTLAGYKCGQNGDFTTTYTRYPLSLENYVDDTVYVAFLHTDPEVGDNSIFIDDVTGPEVHVAPNPPSDPQPEDNAVSMHRAPIRWMSIWHCHPILSMVFSRKHARSITCSWNLMIPVDCYPSKRITGVWLLRINTAAPTVMSGTSR